MVLSARTPHFAACNRYAVVSCACLLMCLLVPLARSADLAELQISETGGVYRIHMAVEMQVPAQYVHRVLTDYKRIYRLDPAIIDSEVLPSSNDDVVRVRIEMFDCIAFFCMKIDRVEDVRVMEQGDLQATIIPSLSDFRSGHTEWKILESKQRTQVIYQAQIEPDFLIPPLIGSYLVKRKLRKSMLASMARIECIARIQAGLVPNPESAPVLVATETADEQALQAALLEGGDPTLIARTPAAGNTVREYHDCDRPCGMKDTSC